VSPRPAPRAEDVRDALRRALSEFDVIGVDEVPRRVPEALGTVPRREIRRLLASICERDDVDPTILWGAEVEADITLDAIRIYAPEDALRRTPPL